MPRVLSAIPRLAFEDSNVYLEVINPTLSPSFTVTGTMLVRNVAYTKHACVRFTVDNWETTSQVSGAYMGHLALLPSVLYSHSHETANGWDRLGFSLHLERYGQWLVNSVLLLAVGFEAPGVGHWWDNNGGENFSIYFRLA